MFAAVLPRLQAADGSNGPLQVTLADQLIGFAATPDAVAQLIPLLAADAKLGSFVLGQSQRWRVVIRATAHALDPNGALLEAECARDKSDAGLRGVCTSLMGLISDCSFLNAC